MDNQTPMKCRQARQLVCGHVDGTLPEGDGAALASHLESCGRCRGLFANVKSARDVLRCVREAEVEVPSDLGERVRMAARRAQEETQIRDASGRPVVGSPAFIATCASLAVAAAMLYAVATQWQAKELEVGAEENTPSVTTVVTAPEGAGSFERGPVDSLNADPEFVRAVKVVSGVRLPRDAGDTRPGTAPDADSSERVPAVRVAYIRRTTGGSVARSAGRPSGGTLASRPAANVGAASLSVGATETDVALVATTGLVREGYEVARRTIAGPAERVSYGTARAEAGSSLVAEVGNEAARGVVAGLLASYVVETYITNEIIEAEPTLVEVTMSVPSSGDTSLIGTRP